MQRKQMPNEIMASYGISHIMVSSTQANLERLELFSAAAPIFRASLNRNLLSGPNLTNQLIGILLRFRTEEVAFMDDIEAIFYQVKVPDSQRSFLKYLWWYNTDLNRKLVDYKMGVHVFGGTSSP